MRTVSARRRKPPTPDFHRHGFRGQCFHTSVMAHLFSGEHRRISPLAGQAGIEPAPSQRLPLWGRGTAQRWMRETIVPYRRPTAGTCRTTAVFPMRHRSFPVAHPSFRIALCLIRPAQRCIPASAGWRAKRESNPQSPLVPGVCFPISTFRPCRRHTGGESSFRSLRNESEQILIVDVHHNPVRGNHPPVVLPR